MSSKSKNKGSVFERFLAKDLSDRYSVQFIRTPHSGAFIGGTNSHRREVLDESQVRSMKGDITPPEDWKKFNCEAKNYADFPFHQLVTNDCKQLDTWINQTLCVADEGDVNVLFIKITRKGTYVVVQDNPKWKRTESFVHYKSEKHGTWLFYDYDTFWKLHTTIFKNMCTK